MLIMPKTAWQLFFSLAHSMMRGSFEKESIFIFILYYFLNFELDRALQNV